jgi:hypothetical protein
MSSIERMSPLDLLNLNQTNLDPLTENYDLGFYLNYLNKWPSLFSTVTDRDAGIVGYSMNKFSIAFESYEYIINFFSSNGQARRATPLNATLRTLHTMARAHYSANSGTGLASTRICAQAHRAAGARIRQ